MKKHLKIGIWISLFAVLSSLISFVATTYAANEGIERKWLANGVAVSLGSDSLHKTISYDDSMSNFLVADSVFDEGVGSIPVPSYGYFDGAEGTITYLEAYKGFSEKQSFNTGGAISYKGFKGYTTTWGNSDYTSDGVPSMLSETGYVATSGSNGNSIQIKGTSTVGGYTEEFAVTIVQEDGNVYLDYSNVPSSYQGIMSYEASEGGLFFRRGEDDYIGPLQLTGDIAADTRTIQTYINGLVVTFGGDSFTFETATSGAKTQFEFRGNPESVAKNLTGVDTLDLTKQERYDLYRYYLDKVAGSMGNSYCVYDSPDKAPDDMIKINLQNNGNEYTNRAQEIVANIIEHQKKDKIRLHRYISKEKNEHANADLLDYTFFLNALLHIYKYTNDEKYDNLISKYTAYIMLNFYQAHNGMFCKTSKTEIITPFKRESIIDYIRYSANSVMARNLLILYKTRKDEFFLSAFKQQLYNIAPQLIGTGPLMVGWALQILNYLSDRSDFD